MRHVAQCGTHRHEHKRKNVISKKRIFLHKSVLIDFPRQIQKEFSKFNHFYACSVKMRFGQILFQLVLHIEKKQFFIFE